MPSCSEDPKHPAKANYDKNELIGRWELVKGFRNGKETETLTGTFYEFLEEGKLRTNLTPTTMEQTFDYKFSDNTIDQRGDVPITYTVDTLATDFLALSMVINNFPFMLHLKKVIPPANLEAIDSSNFDTLKEL